MIKIEKIDLKLCILNALIYPVTVRHDTCFIRITLQCNDCKKANKESGKYSLTLIKNILVDRNDNITNNEVGMVDVEHNPHVHLSNIGLSQDENSNQILTSNKACSSSYKACSSSYKASSNHQQNYVPEWERSESYGQDEQSPETYDQLRGEERDKVRFDY